MTFIKNHFFPILVLFSGLLISLVLFYIFHNIALKRIDRENLLEEQTFIKKINQSWKTVSSNVLSLANFYETTNFVSKDEFLALSSYMSSVSPSIKSIGWWQLSTEVTEFKNKYVNLVYQFPEGDEYLLTKNNSKQVKDYLKTYAFEKKTGIKMHVNTIQPQSSDDLIAYVDMPIRNYNGILLGVLLYKINITALVRTSYKSYRSLGLNYNIFRVDIKEGNENQYQKIISKMVGLEFLPKSVDQRPVELIFAWVLLLFGVFVSMLLSFLIAFNTAKYRKIKESIEKKAESFDEEAKKKEFIQKRLEVYQNFLEKLVDERTSELKQANDYLKANQNILIESEKMASLGLMAAGIAHEINNPMGFIKSNNQTLGEIFIPIKKILLLLDEYGRCFRLVEGEKNRDVENIVLEMVNTLDGLNIHDMVKDIDGVLHETADGISRIHDIVSSLKTFLYQGNEVMVKADVSEIISQSIKVASAAFKQKKIQITTAYDYDGLIECHPNRLSQVIINILNNGSDSFDQTNSGLIHIRVYKEQEKIYIVIKDNGIGMSEDIIKNIFTPFYTTKNVGSGLGLGMYVSYTIIERHKGKITVESKEGMGTVFTIELPLAQGQDDE